MKKLIKCLVVDDEPLAIELLEKHIEQFPNLELVKSCWNAFDAFEVLKNESIDLVFLDIQMPGLTGLELVRSLKNPPGIIFTTAFRQYAADSYELDVIDYLIKPITIDRFLKSVNRYMGRQNQPPQIVVHDPETSAVPDYIYISANRKYVKVVFEDILYVESLKDYVCIHLSNQEISTKDKISDFEGKLPEYFLRIHRSFIVNTRKITAYTAQDIEIDQLEIPIGISYKKEVINQLSRIHLR